MHYKIVNLNGGLGNQMFQYAFGKSLESKFNCEVLYDKKCFKQKPDMYSLNIFMNMNIQFANQFQIIMMQNFKKIVPKFLRRFLNLDKYTIREPKENYSYFYKNIFLNNYNRYFIGYFQNEKYFLDIQDEIRKVFTFPPIRENDSFTKERAEKIKYAKNSVFIHIRRGDYVGLDWQLDMDYYKKAVKIMQEKLENPKFFVFGATDLEFIKNLDLGCEFENLSQIDSNPANHYEDMRLMSMCEHGIIANSTYSWWAAWLSDYDGKIIIAPTPWVLGKDDIIPNRWIKIKR